MLGSTIALSLMHASVRYLSVDLHPFVIAFFRNFLAVLLLFPIIARNNFAIMHSIHMKWHVLRASLNIIAMLMFFYALSITELAVVQALGFTAPLFATILAMVLLREKVRLRRWMALIIGFTGVLIVLRPGAVAIELGPLLVLGSAAVWALTMIIIKRLSNTDSPLTITAWVAIFLTVLSLPTALLVWQWPQGWQWGILLFTAITGTVGQLLLTKAFAYTEASIVMPFDFAKILWSASLGYWVFGEFVSLNTWIGALVIFSGACYVAIREHQLEKQNKRNIQ